MAILPVLRVPDPRLREVCRPIVSLDGTLETLLTDLELTLDALAGCVGIAAPQVGHTVRLVIVDASRYRKPVPNHGRMVLINPVLEASQGRDQGREGCLSLPDFTANVPRATAVRYTALDRNLVPVTVEAEGFEAVVLQHEIDHLDGILFIDRVVCLKTDLFRRKSYL